VFLVAERAPARDELAMQERRPLYDWPDAGRARMVLCNAYCLLVEARTADAASAAALQRLAHCPRTGRRS
jgi:hypothetical protein